MYFRNLLIGNGFRRVESPRICFRERGICTREMLITSFTCCQEPGFGSCTAWKFFERPSSNLKQCFTPQACLSCETQSAWTSLKPLVRCESLGVEMGAFHDKSRAISWRCPPKAVDAMKWPLSQLSLLLSCNMRTTIVDHGPVGHILDLWSLFMSHIPPLGLKNSLHGARKDLHSLL